MPQSDYSYGVYIYAFPVQQALMAWFPHLSVFGLTACALLLSLLCAAASWHVVERPGLRAKGWLVSLRPNWLPSEKRTC